MNKYKDVFDTLKNLRAFAESKNLPGLVQAVEYAENTAMSEICGVDMQGGPDDYEAVMAQIFPQFAQANR